MDVKSIRLSLPAETFASLLSLFAENGCDTEEAANVMIHALLVRHAGRRGIPLTETVLQSGALLDIFVHDAHQPKSAGG